MKTHVSETFLNKAVGLQLATLSNEYEVTLDPPPVLTVKLLEKTFCFLLQKNLMKRFS